MPQAMSGEESGGEPLKTSGKVLLALGANLASACGPPEKTLGAALEKLENAGVVIRAVSRWYHTPAFPAGAGPAYVNGAAELRTAQQPAALLELLHEVEAAFGRVREQRWGQRTLDLDLLTYDDRVVPDAQTQQVWRRLAPELQRTRAPDRLILPHPRLQDRAFVLVPLAEIAPDWVHPLLKETVSEMLSALPDADVAAVRRAE